jgi:MoaA/NifB/PqqE/SkfB family radical SAM enzyme
MRILNLRLGFAMNSSSSHTIFILPNGRKVKDSLFYDFEYGWEFFTLASKDEKEKYMATLLWSNANHMDDEARVDLFLTRFPKKYLPHMGNSYIDHASSLSLPRRYSDMRQIDMTFFDALCEFVYQDNVVIGGGNDNSDDGHWLEEEAQSPNLRWILAERGDNLIAVYDKIGNFWTLFNKSDGTKTRFTFEDGELKDFPQKSHTPQLVDIKISDFCPFNCPFCYTGSTTNGLHGNVDYIKSVIDELSTRRVFELAIGGGEPTLHPNFVDILEYANAKGLVPNFTTKNIKWMNSDDAERIAKAIGGFAVSIETVEDIEKAHNSYSEMCKRLSIFPKMSVHVVMGTVTQERFIELMRACKEYGITPTLLGYKTTHRGSEYNAINYDWWFDVLVKNKDDVYYVAIDTVMSQQYDALLKEKDIPFWMYYVRDGQFSMYIDAVAQKCGESSYANIPLDDLSNPKDLMVYWAKYPQLLTDLD